MSAGTTCAYSSSLLQLCFGAEKYTGPRPPKADIPYLMHADNLIETEVGKAKSDERKDTVVATLPGASSPVKTPLAEPIFLFKADKLSVDKIAAFRLDVKNGQREVVVNAKKSEEHAPTNSPAGNQAR